jgi:hypothetical protein
MNAGDDRRRIKSGCGSVGGVKLLSNWSKVGNVNLRFAGNAE